MSFPFPKPFPGPSASGSASSGALGLLGAEWEGFSLDFITNTYATRTALSAEKLLGPNIDNSDTGVALDFTTNTFAIGR